MVFATLLNSGIPLAVSKSTTVNSKDHKDINGSVTSGLIISIAFSILITIIILVCKNLFVSYFETDIAYTLLLLLIPAIISTGIYSPFKGYLWGKELFTQVSVVEFIEQIIRISCYFICYYLISTSNYLFHAGVSLSVACVLSTIIGIIFFYTTKGRLATPKNHFKPIIKSSTPITLVRLTTSLLQPLIAFVLPLMLVKAGFSNEQALSQLGIAMGMTMPILSIPSTLIGSLAMAIVPNLTGLYNNKDFVPLQKQIKSSINFTLCCSFIVIPCFIALGEPICQLLFNNITAGTYLKNIAWLIVPIGLSQITTSMLNSLNLESKTFKHYLYSCVVSILCILILPKYIGIYSFMYAVGLSTLLVSILNLIKINKTIGVNKTYIAILIKLIIITVPTTFLTLWSYNILNIILGNFVSLIITSLFSVLTFTSLMTIFNIIDIEYIKGIYKSKIKFRKKVKSVSIK